MVPDILIPVAFFSLFGLMFGLIVYASIRQQKRARENLLRLAGELHLDVIEAKPTLMGKPVPSLAGTFRGRTIRIYSYTTGSGKSRTHWCAVVSPVRNPTGMTLRLSKENVFTRAGRKLGIDDVETGDPAFDREFYLKSNKPDFIRVALLPEIRHRLLAAWGKGLRGSLSADASEAKYAEQGSFSDNKLCARFSAAVELVCDVGEVVEACAE